MRRLNWIALSLSVLAFVLGLLISRFVFERMAHLEDEMAYVWQARVIARGDLTLESPEQPKSFLVPFVVDHEGQRFGKYPIGWPVVLAFGELIDARYIINALLAALVVWYTYRLAQRLFSDVVALIAAGLMVSSPFFMIHTGGLLSHMWGLFLSTAFAFLWLSCFQDEDQPGPRWWSVTAGLTLGVFALSRPFTALGIALPFAVHGVIILVRGGQERRKQVLRIGVVTVVVASLHFLWQYAVTGDPLMNPYTLWWSYDRLGFGPGHGVTPTGHDLQYAWWNTEHSLRVGLSDLFGWARFSWIFLPFGLWAVRKKPLSWLLVMVFPVLVLIYLAYWVGAWVLGPRYYFEGLYSLTITSAAGIAWLAGWPLFPGEQYRAKQGNRRWRPLSVTFVVVLLVCINLLFYLPPRLQMLHGLYSIERADLAPLQYIEDETPALIIVHPRRWEDFGALLELYSPFHDSPFIFAYHRGPRSDQALVEEFPGRTVFHYYLDDPYTFFRLPEE